MVYWDNDISFIRSWTYIPVGFVNQFTFQVLNQ